MACPGIRNELRIEILEDKNQKFPIQNHHVHFFVQESQIPEIQAWYSKIFGAKPGMRGQNKAANLPGVNLTFSKADTPTTVTTMEECPITSASMLRTWKLSARN